MRLNVIALPPVEQSMGWARAGIARTNARRAGSKSVCAQVDSPREVPEG